MPPRKTTASKTAGKRKMRQTPESEIEIVEGDILQPPKKKPSRGPNEQPVYKLLPGVSLVDRIDALQGRAVPAVTSPPRLRNKVQSGKTPVAVLADGAGAVTDSFPTRSSRVKVKTEKLLLLEAAKRAGPNSSARETSPESISPSGDDSDASDFPPTPLTRIRKQRDPKMSGNANLNVSDASDHDSVPEYTGTQFGISAADTTKAQPKASNNNKPDSKVYASGTVEAAISVDGGSDVVLDNGSVRASSEIASGSPTLHRIRHDRAPRSPSEDSNVSEIIADIDDSSPVVATTIPVMDRALQDPDTYTMYDDLPHLENICEIEAYGHGLPMGDRLKLSMLRSVVSERSLDLILMGILFTHFDCYVNTARVEPSKLATAGGGNASDSIKLRLTLSARKNENAVGIMIGMVTECFLVDEYTGVSNDKPFSFHKVTVVPLPQEYRRDVALWGKILNFRTIVGSVSALGLSFHTRRKTAYTNTFQSPRTPQKESKYFMTVSSPLGPPRAGSSSNRSVGGYPTSRRFDEKVPIYDGRAKTTHPFTFTPDDFSKLATWPIYKKGRADLPLNSVVAVGYTLNLYSWPAGSSSFQLSTNVQFVILLAIPVA